MNDPNRNLAEVRQKAQQALKKTLDGSPEAATARSELQTTLGLDDLNFAYFMSLHLKKHRPRGEKPLRIREPGQPADAARLDAYPTSIAPPELMARFEIVDYASLKASGQDYEREARGLAFWPKKMQAGTGSSMTRRSYVARVRGIAENEVRIGAKGTDLFAEIPGVSAPIPLAELMISQTLRDREDGVYGEVIFQDIVSDETAAAIEEIWRKPALIDPSRRYGEIATRFGQVTQAHLPTLDEQGELSFNRVAPGGHALFFLEAIRAGIHSELRPVSRLPLLSAISNGEDLSATPDAVMAGWMARERVPIAVVTTDKLPVDIKGGTLSIVVEDDGLARLTILETAQAKEAGQLALFESLGGLLNTNMVLLNYDALVPLLARAVADVGEDALMSEIAPDLIQNWKSQRDPDGVERRYLQMEGAMGSSLMNLDRFWRRRYGEPLVRVINVDRRLRTDFFSPIKSAFDFFMQFHSDRFELDARAYRLRNRRPGELPLVALMDARYQDVQAVLDDFAGASLIALDSLEAAGRVDARGKKLSGAVKLGV